MSSCDSGRRAPLAVLACLCAGCFLSAPVLAQSLFTTFGVQYPAWLEKSGERIALSPGYQVQAGEKLVTGQGGKVWLTMPDGARVKLGEKATLSAGKIDVSKQTSEEGKSGQAADQRDAIDAAFDVLEGAFRYTSDKLSSEWRRNVKIGLGRTATIGIRGTDLWGKVDTAEQFVVLLEGVIDVESNSSGENTNMSEPLAIFKASSETLSSVDMSAVQALAPETELDFGQGVLVSDGKFIVHLASYAQRAAASEQTARLSESGLYAEVSEVETGDRYWYRVSVPGIDSLAGAQFLARRAGGEFGYVSPWVANR